MRTQSPNELLGLLIHNDDDDEELGDDDDLKFKMRGRRWKRLQGGSHAEFIEFSGFFEALHELYSLQCPGGRNAAGVVTSFLAGQGEGGADAGS